MPDPVYFKFKHISQIVILHVVYLNLVLTKFNISIFSNIYVSMCLASKYLFNMYYMWDILLCTEDAKIFMTRSLLSDKE